MNQRYPDKLEQQIDEYVQQRMTPEERVDFEHQMQTSPELQRIVQMESDLTARIRATFEPPSPTVDNIEAILEVSPRVTSAKRETTRRMVLVAGSLAALIAWAFVAWQWDARPELQPHFDAEPLAVIHRRLVANGYRPYYFCEDDERFAMTFQKRQGVPLRLDDSKPDRQMIGLSYAGGLSRDTTAMLCFVEDRPVTVFVDRQKCDQSVAISRAEPDLHVHRKELGTLVIYEVSPFAEPKMFEALRIAAGTDQP